MSGYVVGEAVVVVRADTRAVAGDIEKGVVGGTRALSSDAAKLSTSYKAAAAAGLTLVQVEKQLLALAELRATASAGIATQLDEQIAGLRTYQSTLSKTAVETDRVEHSTRGLHAGFQRAHLLGLHLSGGLGVLGAGLLIASQATQHLTTALEVDGDEAFTTTGRLRNMAALLLHGDLVGGFLAATAHQNEFAEAMKNADLPERAIELSNYASSAGRASVEIGGVADAQKGLESLGGTESLRDTARALNETALAATALAAAFRESQYAAAGATEAIVRAGSEAAALGERGTPFGLGAGGVEAERPRFGRTFTDPSDTSSLSAQVAASLAERSRALGDNLAAARRAAAEIRTRNQNLIEVVEGRAQRYKELVDAETKVALVERQIEDQALAAAKTAEAERKRRAAEAERIRKERERLAAEERRKVHQAYLDDIGFRESLLELNIRRAGLTEKTLVDDRAAERKLIAFYRRASQDRKLSKEEKRRYVLALQSEKIDLASLTNEAKGAAGGDFFKQVVQDFAAFGSNIGPPGSPLSAQDARGAFAGAVLGGGSVAGAIARAATGAAGQRAAANAILNQIARGIDQLNGKSGKPPARHIDVARGQAIYLKGG